MDTNAQMSTNTRIDTDTQILEKKLSYKLQGAFYKIANKYGSTFKENIYHKALIEELTKQKLSFTTEKKIKIYSLDTGEIMGIYTPDLIIDDKIIVEIKAQNKMPKAFETQLKNYLKASKYEIGYLVNFGIDNAQIKRFIYTNDRKSFMASKFEGK